MVTAPVKEPDRVTSVELFTSALMLLTSAYGLSPVGSCPPTPPPDESQLATVMVIFEMYALLEEVTNLRLSTVVGEVKL